MCRKNFDVCSKHVLHKECATETMSSHKRKPSIGRVDDHQSNTKKQKGEAYPRVRTKQDWMKALNGLYHLDHEEIGGARSQPVEMKGHAVVQQHEQKQANEHNMSLCFGEVLYLGVLQILKALNVKKAARLVDFGCGLGKLCVQAFLQFPNLERIVGVEYLASRVQQGIEAMERLAVTERESLHPDGVQPDEVLLKIKTDRSQGQYQECWKDSKRTLEIMQGDMFDHAAEVSTADIVVLNVVVRKVLAFLFEC